jgi:hypothetical protein
LVRAGPFSLLASSLGWFIPIGQHVCALSGGLATCRDYWTGAFTCFADFGTPDPLLWPTACAVCTMGLSRQAAAPTRAASTNGGPAKESKTHQRSPSGGGVGLVIWWATLIIMKDGDKGI